MKFSHIKGIDMPDASVSNSPFDNTSENQMVLGYYRSNNAGTDRYIVTKKGTYKACIGFDQEKIKPFVGNRITHIRFALADTIIISNVTIWINNARDGQPLYTQSIPSLNLGWNEVKLDKSFEIIEDSLLIGIQYNQTFASYHCPLSFVSMGAEKGSCYIYGPFGDSGSYLWYDYGENLSLCLQCIIEGDHIPEYDIRMTGISHDAYHNLNKKKGNLINGSLYLKNWGKKAIKNCTIACSFDGMEIKTISKKYIDTSINECPFWFELQNLTEGIHTISTSIKTINDNKPIYTENDTLTSIIKIINTNEIGRQKVLAEAFIADNIYHSELHRSYKSNHNDEVSFISIHCWDGLSCAAGDSIRKLIQPCLMSAYIHYDRYKTTRNIGLVTLSEAKSVPSFANVNISANYNDIKRQLNIKVTGERKKEFILVEDYTYLTVLLTEDNVIYPQYDVTKNKYIYDYKHPAVLRTNVSDIWGDPVIWDGDKYEMNYTITLDEGWEKDNMDIVAFLAKPFTGKNFDELHVVNCNDLAVKDATTVDIEDMITSEVTSHDVFSVSGVKIKQNTTSTKGLPKGIYIVDGKKVMVSK